MKKIFIVVFTFLCLSLCGCARLIIPTKGGTTLSTTKTKTTNTNTSSNNNEKIDINVSITFQGSKFITYNGNVPYTGLDGVTYTNGMLLPTWVEYAKQLNVNINDVTPKTGADDSAILTQSATNDFKNADIFNGDASAFVKYGTLGNFVALNEHWDKLPNLKKFLDDNPGYYLSLTSSDGNIYYSPYFDGYNEVERMFMMRHDWVIKLLDDDVTYDEAYNLSSFYKPFNNDSLNVKVKGTSKVITKNYEKNIISIQNDLLVKNGKTLTNALKKYIDDTYGNQYAKRSDLFLSENAAYDCDELIALMRCVKANPLLLTGDANTDIIVFFPREKSRAVEILSLAQIFGIRGLSNMDSTLYIGQDGEIHNSYGEEKTLEALGYLNELYKEGLILKDFPKGIGTVSDYRQQMFKTGHGFMTFDYVATTTSLYTTITLNEKNVIFEKDKFRFEAVLPAVCDWDDGINDNYIHFTDSVRTVKSEGWAIPKHVAENTQKLNKVLEFIDYAYSPIGAALVTYGPQAWRGTGNYDYNGITIPEVNAKAIDEIYNMSNGSATDYYRSYVGATLNIGYCKDMGMEYQTLNEQGKRSVDMIANAVKAKALLITTPSIENGYFYLTPPTTYALKKEEQEVITVKTSASTVWKNYRTYYVLYGFEAKIGSTKDYTPSIQKYKEELDKQGYTTYMYYYGEAWNRMKNFFNE